MMLFIKSVGKRVVLDLTFPGCGSQRSIWLGTTGTQDNSQPGQVVHKKNHTQGNQYLRQLVTKTNRTYYNMYISGWSM